MPADELVAVRDALVDNDRVTVIELIDPLVDAFEQRRDREARVSARARQVDAVAARGSDADTAATNALTAVRSAATARTQLTTALSGYLNEQQNTASAVEAAENAIETSEEFESAASALSESNLDLEIPAVLFISAPDAVQIPKGESLDVRLTIENLGTETAGPIIMSAESSVNATVEPTEIGSIEGGEAANVQLVGSPSPTEANIVSLLAEGPSTADSFDISVTVVSRLGYLRRAASRFEELLSDIERLRLNREKEGDGWFKARREEVESLSNRLDQLINRIENGNTSANERRIRQIQQQLEGLRDRIKKKANQSDRSDNSRGNEAEGDDSGQKQEVTEADGALLVSDVTAIIETLDSSLDARI